MQRKVNTLFIDQYSVRFSDKISNTFFSEKEAINGKEIIGITPSKQVNFFILKALFFQWQEEIKKLESPYFDFKDTAVRKAMVSFMNVLSQKILVDEKSFKPLLEHATAETLKMLASPFEYLENHFGVISDSSLSEKNIKVFLKYIKVLKPEFEQLLSSEQQVNTMLLDAEKFFEDLDHEALIGFELSVLSEVESVSYESLFITEEGSEVIGNISLEDELENEIEEEAISEFIEQSVLEEEIIKESQSEIYEESIVQEIDEDELKAEDVKSVLEVEENEELTDEALVGDNEFDKEETELVGPSEEQVIEEEQLEDAGLSLNEKLSEKPTKTINENFEQDENASLANRLQQTKVGSIIEAISVNNRYMFIKELFDGDTDDFNDAIEDLETCKSFDDAVELLVQSHAKNYDWDMNSDEVKELLKVVFRKFR